MRQPSPLSSAPTALAPTATEVVTRPEPGLARGKWEAPPWAFWAMLAVVVLGAVAYLLHRLGILRIGKPNKKDADGPGAASASSRMQRP